MSPYSSIRRSTNCANSSILHEPPGPSWHSPRGCGAPFTMTRMYSSLRGLRPPAAVINDECCCGGGGVSQDKRSIATCPRKGSRCDVFHSRSLGIESVGSCSVVVFHNPSATSATGGSSRCVKYGNKSCVWVALGGRVGAGSFDLK